MEGVFRKELWISSLELAQLSLELGTVADCTSSVYFLFFGRDGPSLEMEDIVFNFLPLHYVTRARVSRRLKLTPRQYTHNLVVLLMCRLSACCHNMCV